MRPLYSGIITDEKTLVYGRPME